MSPKHMRYERFMFMRSPQQALDVIAELIHYQAPLKDQDAWLLAAIKLDFVSPDSLIHQHLMLMDFEEEE